MGFKLRKAVAADLEKLGYLHQLCYPLPELAPAEHRAIFANNPRCDLEDILVVTDRDDLIACMIAYRFQQYQEGVEIPVIGIGSVAVSPQRRREGVAGFMIQEALQLFEGEGAPACILYPFEHRFYRRMGWGYAGEVRQYQIRPSQLEDYEEVLDEDEFDVCLLNDRQLPQVMEFYDSVIRNSNGLLGRNERYWKERILASPRVTVLAQFSGDIIGYLVYSLRRQASGGNTDQEMVVHEWLAPTLDARDALLSFLAKQSDQVQSIRVSLPPDEPFHQWLEDPRHWNRNLIHRLYAETAIVGLGWMYRLVNIGSAFECGRRFNGVTGNLTIEMDDELIGDRRLTVEFSGGSAKVREPLGKPQRIVRGSVDAVSQMFCGYTDAVQAYEQGQLEFEGDNAVEFCQRAFWLPVPRCYDFF